MSFISHFISIIIALVILSVIRNAASESNIYCKYSALGLLNHYTCGYNSSYRHMIQINISDSLLSIACDGLSKLDGSFFTNLTDIPKLQFLFIRECPMPASGFSKLSTNFDMTQVKQMLFEMQPTNESFTGEHFYGLGKLKTLILNKNNISVWKPDTFMYIPNVELLRLDYNNLSLYDNMFQNATNLVFLSISYNNLVHLPNGVFKGLKNLGGLHLTDNQIQEISSEVFTDLTSLTNLNLSSNQLYYLDDKLFSKLPQLSWISLSDNKFSSIPKKIFRSCRPEFVEFYYNLNVILIDGEFSNFFSLEFLELSGNGLVHVPQNLFSNSSNLKSISLHKNRLTFLPEDIFKDQENLEELFLGFNQIESLPPNIFSSLKKIRRLYIEHNSLIKMSDQILPNSLFLRAIDLSYNNISSFEPHILGYTVQEYDVAKPNSTFDAVSYDFRSFLKLKTIDLSHNKLISFPEKSQAVATARSVNMEYNSIKYFNITILRHSNVRKRELNLENNNISLIHFQDMAEILQLYRNAELLIKISQNPIQCDCKALNLVNYLSQENLNFSKGIQFEYLNLKCGGPSSLKNRPLRDIIPKYLICQMEDDCTEDHICDCFYQSSEKKLTVNCSNKYLLTAPQLKIAEQYPSYGGVDSVEVHLEGNNLTEFSENVEYLRVSNLYLHNNFISNVSWIPPSIEVLDLSNNNMGLLDSKLLMTLNSTNIIGINLANNPWSCNCENIEFSHFLAQHISKIVDTDNIKCNASDRNLIDLNDEELCPLKIHRGLVALAFCLLLSFIVIMTILQCYVNRRTILTWLYAHGLCLWLIKEERIDKNKIYDAFISFANEDENFVVENLLPILEKGNPCYKLCLHTRDGLPGEFITTQINRSVRISRRTLVVLSSNFLNSVWGKMEFRTAHTEALKEGRVRVIVIVYGDIDMKSLDDEWKAYMRTNTYIKWGDPWFWEKLRYALPRRHKNLNK